MHKWKPHTVNMKQVKFEEDEESSTEFPQNQVNVNLPPTIWGHLQQHHNSEGGRKLHQGGPCKHAGGPRNIRSSSHGWSSDGRIEESFLSGRLLGNVVMQFTQPLLQNPSEAKVIQRSPSLHEQLTLTTEHWLSTLIVLSLFTDYHDCLHWLSIIIIIIIIIFSF